MNKDTCEILLVEDNVDDAELTKRAFRKNNFNNSWLHLKDGEEALNFIFCEGNFKERNINDVPKLILLDLKMPKVDGIEVLRKIKQDERTRIIPVVILSSSKEEKDMLETYKLGANSYFVKPVEFDGFVTAVSNLGLYWLQLNQLPNQL
ncbi:response regulator [Adhaeribacter terreus]|uniref:Response regulator n=1 Tax=Adhaeribacter terreus TaxID=529703 RepID=A0ABW0ED58_9BACT